MDSETKFIRVNAELMSLWKRVFTDTLLKILSGKEKGALKSPQQKNKKNSKKVLTDSKIFDKIESTKRTAPQQRK